MVAYNDYKYLIRFKNLTGIFYNSTFLFLFSSFSGRGLEDLIIEKFILHIVSVVSRQCFVYVWLFRVLARPTLHYSPC
jgi:hypothetical protein